MSGRPFEPSSEWITLLASMTTWELYELLHDYVYSSVLHNTLAYDRMIDLIKTEIVARTPVEEAEVDEIQEEEEWEHLPFLLEPEVFDSDSGGED